MRSPGFLSLEMMSVCPTRASGRKDGEIQSEHVFKVSGDLASGLQD